MIFNINSFILIRKNKIKRKTLYLIMSLNHIHSSAFVACRLVLSLLFPLISIPGQFNPLPSLPDETIDNSHRQHPYEPPPDHVPSTDACLFFPDLIRL